MSADIRIRAYSVIANAIENGIRRGLARAWKHQDPPRGWSVETENHIAGAIYDAVTNEICEVVDFDGAPVENEC